MDNEELNAITKFLNDIEKVAQKHGLSIGIYENNMKETKSFDITFIPALGYDAQFLQFGKEKEEKLKMKNKPWVSDNGKVFCTVNGWDCPYYKKGECTLGNDAIECDDFYFFWADEIEESEED